MSTVKDRCCGSPCPSSYIRRTNVCGTFVEMGNTSLPSRTTEGLDSRSSFTPFSLSDPTENALASRSRTIWSACWLVDSNSPRSFRTRSSRVPHDASLGRPQDPLRHTLQSIVLAATPRFCEHHIGWDCNIDEHSCSITTGRVESNFHHRRKCDIFLCTPSKDTLFPPTAPPTCGALAC